MAKVRRSMGERSRRWHHVTGSSEDLLADIPDLRESVEELQEQSETVKGAAEATAEACLDAAVSPAPLFHAVSERVRKDFYAAYAGFLAIFREAAEKWRTGDRTVIFPVGCYPPALPFVSG